MKHTGQPVCKSRPRNPLKMKFQSSEKTEIFLKASDDFDSKADMLEMSKEVSLASNGVGDDDADGNIATSSLTKDLVGDESSMTGHADHNGIPVLVDALPVIIGADADTFSFFETKG